MHNGMIQIKSGNPVKAYKTIFPQQETTKSGKEQVNNQQTETMETCIENTDALSKNRILEACKEEKRIEGVNNELCSLECPEQDLYPWMMDYLKDKIWTDLADKYNSAFHKCSPIY